jgi:hypothetical protein
VKLKAFIDLRSGDRRRTAPAFRLCDGLDANAIVVPSSNRRALT